MLVNVTVNPSGSVLSVQVPESRNLSLTTSPAFGFSFTVSVGAYASTDGPSPISTLHPPTAASAITNAAASAFIFVPFFIVFYPLN